MSDEHVFADWVSHLFGYVAGFAETLDANGTQMQWSGTAFQDALPIVCIDCNTRWMSAMEQDVAPILGPMMLHGGQATLPPRFQAKLAAWAVKTAMVANYLPPTHELIPDVQYDDFYVSKKPLPGHLAWVAYRASYGDTARPEDLIAELIRQPLEQISVPGGDPVRLQTDAQKWIADGRRMYRFTFAVEQLSIVVDEIFAQAATVPVSATSGSVSAGLLSCSLPSMKAAPARTSGTSSGAVILCQRAWAASSSL